jgi:hypothetical protein
MRGRLRGWLVLSGPERRTFLALLLVLPLIHVALASAGYLRTRRWLERISERSPRHEPDTEELAYARRLTELAAIAGRRGLVAATCLRQSLLVYTLLRRRGLDPELQIGVRKDGAGFEAHAWVSLGSPTSPNDADAAQAAHGLADSGVFEDRGAHGRELRILARVVQGEADVVAGQSSQA